MKSRVLATQEVRYIPATWDGTNKSGIIPLGDTVIIKVDRADEKIGKTGLLIAAPSMQKAHDRAGQTGVVVAIGDGAFIWTGDRSRPWAGRKPELGDRVFFGRYSGEPWQGDDNEVYVVLTDTQIHAIMTTKENSNGAA